MARIGTLSFGGMVLFALMVPVLNIVIPPIAVISATIYRNKLAS
jgi:CysZ protein